MFAPSSPNAGRAGGGVTIAALVWCMLASPAPTPALAIGQAQAIDLDRYVLTFDEPFDRLDVSPWGPGTRWIAHTPWNGDFGDASFADPEPGFPFTIADGILRITMRRDDAGKLRSGLLASADRTGAGFVQTTGYFEIRARLPAGAGVWPSFWLSTIGVPGKSSPEIDVFEYYGHNDTVYLATAHVWKDGAHLSEASVRIPVEPGTLTKDFHRYGVDVAESGLTLYLDGKVVGTLPPKPEYLLPKFILVNLGAGGGWSIDAIPASSGMEVDYVRAYSRR